VVWFAIALGALAFAAWVGIPLWMTFARPSLPPDYSEAHGYLRAKAALESGEATVSATMVPTGTVPVIRDIHGAPDTQSNPAVLLGHRHPGRGAQETRPGQKARTARRDDRFMRTPGFPRKRRCTLTGHPAAQAAPKFSPSRTGRQDAGKESHGSGN
jgi:hypothetical protein